MTAGKNSHNLLLSYVKGDIDSHRISVPGFKYWVPGFGLFTILNGAKAEREILEIIRLCRSFSSLRTITSEGPRMSIEKVLTRGQW